MDGRPNRRNKAAFPNFSGVVRTLPQSAEKYVYSNLSNQPPHEQAP